MPRLLLSALVWLLTIGGLSLYLHWRDTRATVPVIAIQTEAAEAVYALELTPTFAGEPDPFALQTGTAPVTALLVRLGPNEVLRSNQLPRGRVLRIEPLPGLVVGDNEVYVEASPPADEAELAHALRVRVLQGTRELVDQTLWAPPGGIISAPVRFTLPAEEEDVHDRH
jgi:hypothetical protein